MLWGLAGSWGSIQNPSCLWHTHEIEDIMYACCNLHHMIIENEDGDEYKPVDLGNILERGFVLERHAA